MNILGYFTNLTTVGAYRIWQPLDEIERQRLANTKHLPVRAGYNYALAPDSDKYDPEIGCWGDHYDWADVVIHKPISTKVQLATIFSMHDLKQVPYVVDMDDDMLSVRRTNPNYGVFKDFKTTELEDTHFINEFELDKYGKEGYSIWKIEEGKYVASKTKQEEADRTWTTVLIKNSMGVIVTNEHLAAVYRQYGKNTYVIPNYIDMNRWTGIKNPEMGDGMVRLGYFGSTSHYEDLLLIKDLIPQILDENPNVIFVFAGSPPAFFGSAINKYKERFQVYPWSTRPLEGLEKEYYLKVGIDPEKFTYSACPSGVLDWERYFANVAFDVSLAPLIDDQFNKGKSNIKWMEAAMLKIPTIASNTSVYSCIKDKIDGFLVGNYKDLYKRTQQLVRSKTMREDMGNAAYETVVKNWNLQDHVHEYIPVMEDVIRRYKLKSKGIILPVGSTN